MLLHLIDIAPPDPAADPVKDARTIVAELKKFAADLAKKERWLLINKIDLLEPKEAQRRAKEIVRRLRWKGPVLLISGATGEGTEELKQAVDALLEKSILGRWHRPGRAPVRQAAARFNGRPFEP